MPHLPHPRTLLLSATLGLLCATAASTQTPADDPLAQARSLFQSAQLPQAEHVLQTYLARNPASAPAMYLLGYVLQRENHPADSLAWFTKAAAVTPPSPDDLKIVALDYVLLNDYKQAIHWLQRALQSAPSNPDLWYDLGRAQMSDGDYTSAEQAFHRVLALAPRSSKAENNLGLTYEAQNRTADALLAYRNAIAWQQSDPHPSEQPLLNYGTLLVSQNRGSEALPVLQQATRIAPTNQKCHEQLARALEQTGDLPHALPELKQAVDLDPRNARLHYQLGQLYRRTNQPDLARQELTLSAQLYGSHHTPEDK